MLKMHRYLRDRDHTVERRLLQSWVQFWEALSDSFEVGSFVVCVQAFERWQELKLEQAVNGLSQRFHRHFLLANWFKCLLNEVELFDNLE